MRRAISPFTLSAVSTGTVATFPQLTLADTFVAQKPYRLVGIDLNLSAENSTINPMGLFVIAGQRGATLAVSQTSKILAAQTCQAGVIANLSEWCGFGDYYIDVPSGYPISLYVCGGAIPVGVPLFTLAVLHCVDATDE